MGGFGSKLCFGGSHAAATVSCAFAIWQFVFEIIAILCLATYVVPLASTIKTFYALAAFGVVLLLILSGVAVYSISKNNPSWMRPWLVGYFVASLCEVIIAFIAFANLSGLHGIFDFYSAAWSLTSFLAADQLFIGNYDGSSCSNVRRPDLPYSSDGAQFAAGLSRQGAHGFIAYIVLFIILKNILNVWMLIVSFTHYRNLQLGKYHQKTYGSSAKSHYYDPHLRPGAPRRFPNFIALKTISK
ncbi:unnamed protein product [Clavelina lepadiformis]|uniref:MARVEL domain-containing protein n=1 Tax=Clavelina lepadiformis TaxID=159417 RepID=A0ABP0FDE5_CLALP